MNQVLKEIVKKGIQVYGLKGQMKVKLGNATLSDAETSSLKMAKEEIVQYLKEDRIGCISNAQERLWFLAEFGNSAQYHVSGMVRLEGKLDVGALQKTINQLAQRHQSLRTFFKSDEGQPFQMAVPSIDLPIESQDISSLDLIEQPEKQREIIQAFTQKPFSLDQPPLARFILIKNATDNHVLGMCMHHIISDGWSIGILINELSAIYNAEVTGEPIQLPALKIQYIDYASWQQSVLTEEKVNQELDFWKEKLEDYTDIDLPTDFVRPSQLSGKGANHFFALDPDLVAGLKNKCLNDRVTLYSALMTGVYLLLQRYSSQSDICLGMPVSNRTNRDLEDIVGLFVNTLVLRVNPEKEDIQISELIKQVNHQIIEAQDNKNLPFEKLIEEIKPPRDLSRTPIFQVLVNYLNAKGKKLKIGDCEMEIVDSDYQVAKFDLSFNFSELDSGELILGIQYSTDLYEASSIERMSGHLERILDSMVKMPTVASYKIELLDTKERKTLLEDWNQTSTPYPGESLHQLIVQQAVNRPEATAIVHEGERITYSELIRKSNQLALYLQEKKVGKDTLVGLFVERTPDMIVGMLGILMSGGAYLPIDPDYPEDRIQYMIEDSGIELLITQGRLEPTIRKIIDDTKVDTICVDDHWANITSIKGELVNIDSPENMAYVIYTSGSTGKPKGVVIEHHSVVNFLVSMQSKPGFTHNDKLLAVTTYCFDISILEIFLPLVSGGQVHIVNREVSHDPNLLERVISDIRPTVMQATPATWTMLFQNGWRNHERVKVLCGGEALGERLRVLFEESHTEVWNMFGPTETTIWSTIKKIGNARRVTIGYPINNTQVYILDKMMNPTPIGVPGELHIGGDGLARGYFKRPGLTSERFVRNPFSAEGRIYKTGDLARFLPNGEIEHLGRLDSQVKIRGFRIELGEIENLLTSHEHISEAAVVVQEHQNNKLLVAFYTSSSAVEISDIKNVLQQSLPDYMIPIAFENIEKIPLTPNGKINRKVLEKRKVQIISGQPYVAPETELEEKIVKIWEEVLGVERVGMMDNFFDLGGHSLLATQIVSRVNKEMSVDIPLVKLFRDPTVRHLTQMVMESEQVGLKNVLSDFANDDEELTF